MQCRICFSEEFLTIGTSQECFRIARLSSNTRCTATGLMDKEGWLQDFKFLRCEKCGFTFIDSPPSTAYLNRFYDHFRGSRIYSAKKDKKIRRSLKRIRSLKKLVPGRRFLDVGCNLGYAVEAARLEGFSAAGIDPDAHAVSLARRQFPDATFHVVAADSLAENGEEFDLVHCTEVIEHLPDVRPFARSLAALTRPGGLLYLTTPDAGHFRVPKNFLEWTAVNPPAHLCWFSRKNLRMLFEDLDFQILRFSFNLKPGIKMLARRRQIKVFDRP